VLSYLKDIWHGVTTTAKGMRLTWRHFFTRPTTIQYPDPGEETYFSPYERGLHEFEPDACIVCYLCAKACPVDCIRIEEEKGVRKGGKKVLTVYEIDYNKCLFCELCVDPCPVDCIHMGTQYDLASFDRTRQVKVDYMRGEGPWRTAATSADPQAGLRAHLKGPHPSRPAEEAE
jgi:NADH-quinone oxidoreductase subunit I